jgi:5'(3')-deoxyribonucleotidase
MSKVNTKGGIVKIYNRSNQMIPLQLMPPKGDFFLNQQVVYLGPKRTVKVPKSYINEDQINNLQSRRELQILFDSDDAADRQARARG